MAAAGWLPGPPRNGRRGAGQRPRLPEGRAVVPAHAPAAGRLVGPARGCAGPGEGKPARGDRSEPRVCLVPAGSAAGSGPPCSGGRTELRVGGMCTIQLLPGTLPGLRAARKGLRLVGMDAAVCYRGAWPSGLQECLGRGSLSTRQNNSCFKNGPCVGYESADDKRIAETKASASSFPVNKQLASLRALPSESRSWTCSSPCSTETATERWRGKRVKEPSLSPYANMQEILGHESHSFVRHATDVQELFVLKDSMRVP
ncbi:uncharacterized protein LOC121094280 isoform X2 [Falco naumanni]|uniref:uncharacterized protein LOC121094280 isoform X2 n=1 Tax=Falco naumanni TaxID=148594 RepID=UPI001ADEBAD1|nr:uncharacterized protein LOC121094280 isoform X2 [Falco naumanni]